MTTENTIPASANARTISPRIRSERGTEVARMRTTTTAMKKTVSPRKPRRLAA